MQVPFPHLVALLALAASATSQAGETRSTLLMGQELSGLGSGFRFGQTELSADLFCEPGSMETRAEGRLDLPHGAHITAWRAWVGDNLDEGDLSLELIERCRSGSAPSAVDSRQLGNLATTGAPGDAVLTQTLPEPATTDTDACTYTVRVDFGVGTGGCSGFNRRIYQIRADHAGGTLSPARGTSSLDGSALDREQYDNLYATTPAAERYCLGESSGAYFTTRMSLPDRAVPLEARAWMHDEDPLWDADATFRLLCRGADAQLEWRDLAFLHTSGSSGASFHAMPAVAAVAVDQRECALFALTASNRGDPCVSEQLRHGRVGLTWVLDPVFESAFDAATGSGPP